MTNLLGTVTYYHKAHYPQAYMSVYLFFLRHLKLLYQKVALAYLEKLLYPTPKLMR